GAGPGADGPGPAGGRGRPGPAAGGGRGPGPAARPGRGGDAGAAGGTAPGRRHHRPRQRAAAVPAVRRAGLRRRPRLPRRPGDPGLMPVYLQILRERGTPRLVLAALTARIPDAVAATAIVVLVRATTGSYPAAGAAAGAFGIGTAVSAPLAGRALGRPGQRPALPP